MVRFIIKHRFHDAYGGGSGESFHTLQLAVPELEAALKRGGHGPSGFDYYDLIGVEIEEDAALSSKTGGDDTARLDFLLSRHPYDVASTQYDHESGCFVTTCRSGREAIDHEMNG